MNKLVLAVVAASIALGSASGFAADAMKKKEELTAEQKTEIRDRADRLKAERARTEQAAPAVPTAPAKVAPKRTSKAKTHHGNRTRHANKAKTHKARAKV